jgi:hypothetical protein
MVAAGAAIYGQRGAFRDSWSKVGPVVLVESFLLGTIGICLTFPPWLEVLRGLDVDMPTGAGARVFLLSQLGKYLPGSVWPVVAQMEAGRARGALRRTMLAANLLTIVLSCTVGLLMACVILPFADASALSKYWWLLVAVPVLVALLHPRAMPGLLDLAFRLLRRGSVDGRIDLRHTLIAAAWSTASFLFLGLHIAVLAIAIGGANASTFALAIGGMSLAVPAGVLFIPAPAGAGIRDVVLVLVLSSVLTSGQALVVVVASRVVLVLADLALAGAAALFLRHH